MKKVFIYSTLGIVLVLSGVYVTSNAYAQDSSGGNVSEVVREEHRAEREAEMAEKVVLAMEEGKITERQAEILDAMADLRPETGRGMFGAGKDLSEEERTAMREEMRAEREGAMLDALNEKGMEVTHEELEELRVLREELGLMGNQNGRGGNGGQGMGDCQNS